MPRQQTSKTEETPPTDPANSDSMAAAIAAATRRISPLWPLRSFVAVNPFLAYAGSDFETTADAMAWSAGARVTMPTDFYARAIADGRISMEDLDDALASARPSSDLPRSSSELAEWAARRPRSDWARPERTMSTVADTAARLTGKDWPRLVLDRISFWAAAYFDAGQASWRSPWRGRPPYEAWRAEASIDRTPEIMGLPGFRRNVRELPDSTTAAIEFMVRRLCIPEAATADYLYRLLMSIGGWASYTRGEQWRAELDGGGNDAISGLLAIRLAWETCLLTIVPDLPRRWGSACVEMRRPRRKLPYAMRMNLVLHRAYERGAQRRLLQPLTQPPAPTDRSPRERREAPQVQAVFCIDVRSEVIRRHLESVSPCIETLGFAGFFGVAVDYVPFGDRNGSARCPVLLAPKFRIEERPENVSDTEVRRLERTHQEREQLARAWKSLKLSAVASFGFVETVGVGYAAKLVRSALSKRRSNPAGRRDAQRLGSRGKFAPTIEPCVHDGSPSGIPFHQRVVSAEGILRGMSLTTGFARLVLLVGHGATTANNPHARGLDCGACGGHAGDVNARIAARILNDTSVREALRARGIDIPDTTLFLACLHDTTTDDLHVLDRARIPASHAGDLKELGIWFATAGRLARKERVGRLDVLRTTNADDAIRTRSGDWSQVRPEWGLAGCATFIAAPRSRTAGSSLGGRAFLHSYDWKHDTDFSVLELIMTAPMIVASWINLQYFASTVDNSVFGCGNKVLHNVVGTIGVLEGNGGDLRTGLPLQSLCHGNTWAHDPVRLTAVIEAPEEAINGIIMKHAFLRELVDNQWISLVAIDDSGVASRRYTGAYRWTSMSTPQHNLNVHESLTDEALRA